jgi:hypothetical protein
MKIVINRSYGIFRLSSEAHALIAARKGWKHACSDYDIDYWYDHDNNPIYDTQLNRSDKDLIDVVEELGENANGTYSELKVVNIPDGINFSIEEYDGLEHVAEKHRTWS